MQVNTTPEGSSQPQKAAAKAAAGALTPAAGQDNGVMDVLENTLWNRQLGVMSEEIVAALVCQIFEGAVLLIACTQSNWQGEADGLCGAGIRDHVVQAVELKFNCFFLMPVVDSFPTRLREELESAYDDDIDEVFDVTAVRNALESRLKALESELHQVRRIACDNACSSTRICLESIGCHAPSLC